MENRIGLQENGWDAGLAMRGTFRSPWKYISRTYPALHQLVRTVVRKETRVRFLEDRWWVVSSFQDLFPSLFQMSTAHHMPISHFAVVWSSSSFSWNLHFCRSVKEVEVEELSALLGVLEGVRLSVGVEDVRVWVRIFLVYSQSNRFMNPSFR